jgi:hypothetical protein
MASRRHRASMGCAESPYAPLRWFLMLVLHELAACLQEPVKSDY